MENANTDQKEVQIESLTPAEKESLVDVVTEDDYEGMNVAEIKKRLVDQLLHHEKKSIYEISEIDEDLRSLREQLESLDNKFKDLEGVVEKQTNEYLGIIGDLSNFESQVKIVDIRMKNYEQLKDCTKSVFRAETEFSRDDLTALTDPDFEDPLTMRDTVEMLTKLGKYIRNSNRFQENQFILQKNKEFTQYVNTFEARLREYIKKLVKRAEKYYSESDHHDDTYIVETKFFRDNFKGLKPVFKQLYYIYDCSESYFRSLIKDVALPISEFTAQTINKFEKRYKTVLSSFNIFKSKWNITSPMEINVQNLNENPNNKMKLTEYFKQIASNFDDQMESDENYWTQFFSFDERNLAKGNTEIKFFLTSIYTFPKQKLIELLNSSKKLSAISTIFVLAEVKKIMEAKRKEDEDLTEREREAGSFTYSTMNEIYMELNNQNNAFAQEQAKFLKQLRMDVVRHDVLLPIKNFTSLRSKSLAVTLYQIFAQTNKDVFILNIKEIFDEIVKWLYEVVKTDAKSRDLLIIENSYYMFSKLQRIQDPKYQDMANEMKDVFERQSKVYAKGQFAKTFPNFADYWFKIREISNQTDITSIQQSGPYSKTNFIKTLKATFSTFSREVDKLLKRLIGELSKEGGLIMIEYDKITEFFIKEYTEIEQFASKAYNEKINPSKAEIQAVMLDKRPQ